ncbi:FAD binding domain-containing protein [Mycolicibacterium fluoranthenivorans]|uniref:FAD binding domain-containing protein n=1 Tax=Mycolicibacterium fluoranthenivorans TaxID=258505 RepID=A0A7G8PIL7_9MYCO|nr:FAD binding domain-containing protein [Mycolicibacterium fluoranthenivorans]QNJ94183.1 FAD binding domain-containing protein [Mycolicibacterium fluoranthenivorans]
MDLNTVTEVIRRPTEPPGALWRPGDAWLAGGTWLFSDPQPKLRRLIDLAPLGWSELEVSQAGLHIGAMCTIGDLYALAPPAQWPAARLIPISCEAFLSSFKVWNAATVGGNICMSLPAGPMITLTVALEAEYLLQAADGTERRLPAADFVTGNNRNVLAPGELLRGIDIPDRALRKRVAHRRFTLTTLGRSTVFLIGTKGRDGATLITLTAGTTHPVRLAFAGDPDPAALRDRIDELAEDVWFDDANGAPDHRRHLTKHFAAEIAQELRE